MSWTHEIDRKDILSIADITVEGFIALRIEDYVPGSAGRRIGHRYFFSDVGLNFTPRSTLGKRVQPHVVNLGFWLIGIRSCLAAGTHVIVHLKVEALADGTAILVPVPCTDYSLTDKMGVSLISSCRKAVDPAKALLDCPNVGAIAGVNANNPMIVGYGSSFTRYSREFDACTRAWHQAAADAVASFYWEFMTSDPVHYRVQWGDLPSVLPVV